MEFEDGFVIGMALGGLLAIIIFAMFFDFTNEDAKELGQSICEQEYNQDFLSYDNGILKCQEQNKQYDGLKVMVSQSIS